ncbi:glycosyltransferase [Rhodobacterales bacterium HKCCE3408]|nr:glycosyltransferase [Rhodobacterales bacterium HKCCE3408]
MTAHVESLFGGNSIVVSRTRDPSFSSGRPSLALEDFPISYKHSLSILIDYLQNWQYVRTIKAPVGAQKDALERFLSDQAPDAMLIEQGHEAKYFWASAKRLGIPVFVYFRGVDATGYLRRSRHQAGRIKGYRKMMMQIDGVFAVSQFLISELAAHGISHPNTHIIPSGVELLRFSPAEKRPGHVMMAGRLIEKKAPLVSLGAFLRASEGIPGAHLHVVGDGPLRTACEGLVATKGAKSRVSFHGHLDHGAVAKMMAWVPIFIQHSVTSPDNDKEGAPTSIQEAMAAGMSVLSTLHAGIPDLVQDGETGFLVKEHAADDFAQRLYQMLTAPESSLAMGKAAHEFAKRNFDKTILHSRLEAVLRRYCGTDPL